MDIELISSRPTVSTSLQSLLLTGEAVIQHGKERTALTGPLWTHGILLNCPPAACYFVSQLSAPALPEMPHFSCLSETEETNDEPWLAWLS